MKRFCLVLALSLLAGLSLVRPGFAVNPDEVLADPALESRAREISLELRCLVCQNQSIDDSNADLAHDLRVLVRERLKEGDTDEQVLDYVVSRYGEFVLLKPRFSVRTILLWGTPVLILLIGIAAILMGARNRAARRATPALSAEEQAEIDRLMKRGE
ncbi:cytochrome c-type biogenesis protein CcmH [Pseudohoeflea suaedae]|uniref:Cytochrome c-type biogenesis protein n=1 Tax=Pseudohoeflea suaedae TaxID=877384 RepID=A0A4R5PP60_9HYPH|nr:cytochrome c-type biogenesis protein [Pseudohoeflea suaedae]TDH38864.1 cytochrome c-type biogenesis protein CcmH [Pseudohoeflea suaedae]